MYRVPERTVPSHLDQEHVTVIGGVTHYDILASAEFLDACTEYIKSTLPHREGLEA